MKRTQRRQHGKSAFDLIEESTHLLRTAPATTLAAYFLGAIPFVLGLLFFWADMSRSPLAPQHLAGASLGMAALFFWMKFWQTVFARRVRAQAAGEPFSPLSFRAGARIFLTQAAIQSSALFILPLSLIPVLPFPWVCAFYQNAIALDDGTEAGTAALLKKSRRQAALWPMQNHAMLAILLGFAFCVFLNWVSVCLALPQLCKMLFGIESDFTKSPMAMLNTTFFAAMLGLTYLCVDPILKTIYALRCFYGESLESGEDLKAELKPFTPPALKTSTLTLDRSAEHCSARTSPASRRAMLGAPIARFMVLAAIFSASPLLAESTNAPAVVSVKQTIPPPDLDRVINQTIHESKYVWRMPREQVIAPDAKDGVIAQFFQKIGELVREWARDIRDLIVKILRMLFHRQPGHVQKESGGYGWIMSLQILLYGLVAAVVIALAVLLYRVWRARSRPPAAVASEAIQTAPDLEDENVRADHLPEDGWTKLARELLERGEFRLAMRAFYLAGLAHLAARNLISIARFKSNRDYERELRRRAHAFPDLLAVFGDSVSVFERIWYGMHEVNCDLVNQFASGLERLKGG